MAALEAWSRQDDRDDKNECDYPWREKDSNLKFSDYKNDFILLVKKILFVSMVGTAKRYLRTDADVYFIEFRVSGGGHNLKFAVFVSYMCPR